MTDNALSLAALNVTLLEAIQAGPAASPSELAERAGLVPNNIQRKLESLLAADLIARTGEATCDVELTSAGTRALDAMAIWREGIVIEGVTMIPFEMIDRWPGNPRTQFDEVSIEELAQSIADKGVLQPITVRARGDRYEVIIGERRRRAAARAIQRGWAPAGFGIPCQVREIGDLEAEELAGVENIQREDMHWMDEAQWFLKLAQRLSGPAIERLIGGQRKTRSIQDYIKCARELSEADIARCYLPDGDKDQLTYVRARDLVGEKKAKPAIDVTAKEARAFLELIALGVQQAHGPLEVSAKSLAVGQTIVTYLGAAPAGPLDQVGRFKKLTDFGFAEREGYAVRQMVARTILTEPVMTWLTSHPILFTTDPHGALYRVREPEVGAMMAARYGADEWLTPELNPPPKVEAPASPPPPGEQPAGPDAIPNNERQAEAPSLPHEESGAAGASGSGAPSGAPAEPQAKILPPMLAIVVVEVAHKISAEGEERGPGTWAVPIQATYYDDKRISDLVIGHKMLAFMPKGDRMMVALGKAGRDWLWETHAIEEWPEHPGQVCMSDAQLLGLQEELIGRTQPKGGPTYSSPWLNPPAPEATAEEPLADPLAPGIGSQILGSGREDEESASPPPGAASDRSAFGQSIIDINRESRAWNALAAAAEQADRFIAGLKGKTKPPKAEDVEPVTRLLQAALEAVAPYRAGGEA